MRTLKAVPLHKIYGDWGYGEPALFPLVRVISTHLTPHADMLTTAE